MPPQLPSASWRRMIHCSARRNALRRSSSDRVTFVLAQDPIEFLEPAAVGTAGEGVELRALSSDPQLVEAHPHRSDGPVRGEHSYGHDGLASPARKVVDVEGRRRRKENDLGRHRRKLVPFPQAEQRHPYAREDSRAFQPSRPNDVGRRPFHVGSADGVASQLQRPIGLHRGGQVGRAAIEVRPGAVVALVGADPVRRSSDRVGVAYPQELAQEQVLCIHRDVGLELALPPSLGVLDSEERADCAVEGVARGVDAEGVEEGLDGSHFRTSGPQRSGRVLRARPLQLRSRHIREGRRAPARGGFELEHGPARESPLTPGARPVDRSWLR